MFEIFVKLIEEPEKRKKYIVFISRTVLTCILTSFLYMTFISKYVLLDISNPFFWSDLYDFSISGTAVLVLFLYLICNVLLFEVIAPFINSFLNFLFDHLSKVSPGIHDHTIVQQLLFACKVLKYDKETGIISSGKEFETFYTIIKAYRKKAIKAEINRFSDSLISGVTELFYVFVLIYFSVTDMPKNIFVIILTVIVGFTLLLAYRLAKYLIKIFDAHERGVIDQMMMIEATDLVIEKLQRFIIYPEPIVKKGHIECLLVKRSAKDIVAIYFYYGMLPISKDKVSDLHAAMITNGWRHILIISCRKPSQGAREKFNENGQISLLVYKSKKSLKGKLESLLKL